MVKLSHTLFALPFALAGAALAASRYGIRWEQVAWILVAMVGARNAAMGFNRLADERIDARNPRTANRELPRRRLSRPAVWTFTLVLAAAFVLAAERLDLLWLAPVALVVVFGYSYTKRFTWTSHLVLGVALAMAPLGGWLATGAPLTPTIVALALAVVLWVAGFDVLYACQDAEFDRREKLHSIPARFGVGVAIAVARAAHGGALVALAAVGLLAEMHPVYWAGWLVIGALLAWEHRLVRADDLSRLDVAFFRMNGVIAVVYLATVLAAVLADRVA
jgi:4-hydroxybenzoate polyprenyltransferase